MRRLRSPAAAVWRCIDDDSPARERAPGCGRPRFLPIRTRLPRRGRRGRDGHGRAAPCPSSRSGAHGARALHPPLSGPPRRQRRSPPLITLPGECCPLFRGQWDAKGSLSCSLCSHSAQERRCGQRGDRVSQPPVAGYEPVAPFQCSTTKKPKLLWRPSASGEPRSRCGLTDQRRRPHSRR